MLRWFTYAISFFAVLLIAAGYLWADAKFGTVTYEKNPPKMIATVTPGTLAVKETKEVIAPAWPALLDTGEYDKRLLVLAGYEAKVIETQTSTSSGATSTKATTTPLVSPLIYSSTTNVIVKGKRWPTAAPYPNGGAVLPFQRIVAYYGNFYSRQMGILGELDPEPMLARLKETTAMWEKADPTTPVLPAIEYIAMVAQGAAGPDGMYRAVMPDTEIDKAYTLAQKTKGVMILDIQVGLSNVRTEVPKFKKYLEKPDVFFAIDPEFSMKGGEKPGTVIGTFDATDVNYTIDYLANIVKENHLPPKVLLVHRFTEDMVTAVSKIKPRPEVQVVIVMDGWGPKDLKYGTYTRVIEPEPVQFTGIKLFYKNDVKVPSTGMLSPAEVMALHPRPIYIQYQ
jgi:hypothetical protein